MRFLQSIQPPPLLGASLGGALFGALLDKSSLADPEVIHSQLQLKDFRMLKVFLSAVGSGMVSHGLYALVMGAPIAPKPVNVVGNLLGGSFMGVGLALTRGCPGTLLAQLGTAGNPGVASWALLGGLVGSGVYVLLESRISRLLQVGAKSVLSLPEWIGWPYAAVALPIAGLMGAAVWALHHWSPKKDEETEEDSKLEIDGVKRAATKKQKDPEWWRMSIDDPSFHPVTSGVLIGLLQVPMALLSGSPFGVSTAFASVMVGSSALLLPKIAEDRSYSHYLNPRQKFQFIQDIAIICGAYLSSAMSGRRSLNQTMVHGCHEPRDESVTGLERNPCSKKMVWIHHGFSFWGGFLTMFGARIANGCTASMGLSGIAQLGISGFLSMGSMFALATVGSWMIDRAHHHKNCHQCHEEHEEHNE